MQTLFSSDFFCLGFGRVQAGEEKRALGLLDLNCWTRLNFIHYVWEDNIGILAWPNAERRT